MPWVFISCRLSIIKEDGFLFILSRKRTAFVIYYASTRSVVRIILGIVFYFILNLLSFLYYNFAIIQINYHTNKL